ncbi:MAG: hypothetical protein QXF01_02300, partial [Candidatus Micrarchaeaceae archaeon]
MADDAQANVNATEDKPKEAPKQKPRRAAAAKSAKPAEGIGQQVAEAGAAQATEKRERKDKKGSILNEMLIFGKYDPGEVKITDGSIEQYVNLRSYINPNIYGRRKFQAYYASHISVVERLANKLMRGGTGKKVGGKVIRTEGRLQGKKMKVMKIMRESFEIVNRQTGKNPL